MKRGKSKSGFIDRGTKTYLMSQNKNWQLLNQRMFWRWKKKSFYRSRIDIWPRCHFLWWANFRFGCVYCLNNMLNSKRRSKKRKDSDRNDTLTLIVDVFKVWKLNASLGRKDNLLRKSKPSSFLFQLNWILNLNLHKPCRLLHENVLRSIYENWIWWTKNSKT